MCVIPRIYLLFHLYNKSGIYEKIANLSLEMEEKGFRNYAVE